MEDTQELTVSCRVKNTGSLSGSEVVQLYVGDEESRVQRPVRKLKGFERVDLAPGEEKTVTFHLNKQAFAYYEPKIHDWFVESGVFRIEIGASSRDIRLVDRVTVNRTMELPLVYTRLSTVGDLAKAAKGRDFIQQVTAMRQKQHGSDLGGASVRTMGEGSEKMMQKMMSEMPLSNLVTYGVMTLEQIDNLISTLNS